MQTIGSVDITRIDLNLLAALAVLLEERSVTRAARRLGLTQPTVSGMLARLRDLLGDPLFVRARRGLVPTPRAEALRPALVRLLEDARAVVDGEVFHPETSELTLRVAANDYVQASLMVPFVAALRVRAPHMRVALRPSAVGDLTAALPEGAADLAVTVPELAPEGLHTRSLYQDRYVCAVRQDHPIRGRRVSVERFCAFDHALVSPAGPRFRGPMDDALERLGAKRRVAVSVPNFSVLPALLAVDDLIAIVPERFLHGVPHGLRAFRPPIELPGFGIIAAWHPRTEQDPAHRWLRDLLALVASRVARTGSSRSRRRRSA